MVKWIEISRRFHLKWYRFFYDIYTSLLLKETAMYIQLRYISKWFWKHLVFDLNRVLSRVDMWMYNKRTNNIIISNKLVLNVFFLIGWIICMQMILWTRAEPQKMSSHLSKINLLFSERNDSQTKYFHNHMSLCTSIVHWSLSKHTMYNIYIYTYTKTKTSEVLFNFSSAYIQLRWT